MVHTVERNSEGFTNHQVTDTENARQAYNMVVCPSPRDSERMVRGNMIRNFPITIADVHNAHKCFVPDIGPLRGKTVRRTPETELFWYLHCTNPYLS